MPRPEGEIVVVPPSSPPGAARHPQIMTSAHFESQHPYDAQRIRAAAIYCSDGRFGEHCDDFLQNGLGLPRYDRLVIPGGPGNLAGHMMTYRECEALAQQMQFLVEAHGLERVVLIAHEGCAFYSHRLHIAPADTVDKQFEDLRKAADRIRTFCSRLKVEAHMAWRRDDRIVFDEVSLAPAQRRDGELAWGGAAASGGS